uniref:Chitin-binding type-2 domain-containing protein n=1 Tax=Megaselia scalaris TaxID=36166 RepID=T1GW61_MEGSC
MVTQKQKSKLNVSTPMKFLDDMQRLPDVYFVTGSQVINWMKNPTKLENIKNFQAWSCRQRQWQPKELACSVPNTCKLKSRILQQERYMNTCSECPQQYPWVRNEFAFSSAHNVTKRSLKDKNVECLEKGRFYRDPNRPIHKLWTTGECGKYYLCLENEVFEFKCSEGLLFDIIRQICDFKQNVENCDITTEIKVAKPLLKAANCLNKNHLGCADGTCLPSEYFCDGYPDCPDSSDEGFCDQTNDPNRVAECDTTNCRLPSCFCSKDGTVIPNHLRLTDVPQMIVLTFEDAINHENWELFSKYTNYQHVQKLWNAGHEIAVHSVTHRGPEEWWSKNATIEDWFDEMVGQANIINKFAKTIFNEKEFGFVYDSSMVSPFSNPPLWPYTLDYKIPHSCMGVNQNCPTRSYSGVWELVLNQLEAGDYTCGVVDSCPSHLTGDEIYRMLTHNFKRHYLSNRAPYGLYFHSTWFKKVEYLNAFL